MGAFLEAEKKRQAAWKVNAPWLSDAARSDGRYREGANTGRTYPFCLNESFSEENLFPGIRERALEYFDASRIPWHDGVNGKPSSHLCDSQVCCVNFLAPFMDKPQAIRSLLQPLFPGIRTILPMEDRLPLTFVSFEWIGLKDYLGECRRSDGRRTRGANATSADAAIMFDDDKNKRYIVLIEWKYTESYSPHSKAISARNTDRTVTYRRFWTDGPLDTTVVPHFGDLFYEPFYQLMRQQMLAHELEKSRELGAGEVIVLHVAPATNQDFQYVTSPGLRHVGKSVTAVWKQILRDPSRFVSVTTSQVFGTFMKSDFPQLREWKDYLVNRYASII